MSEDNTDLNLDSKKSRRKSYQIDLRIHSPTSLAYLGIEGIDTAPAMVRLAKVKGLDLISITDYYSARYIDRVLEAAAETKITVLPGVVIRAALKECNDVNLTVFFPEEKNSHVVTEFLKALKVPQTAEGSLDYIVGGAFSEVIKTIEEFGAICIPSRMDKTPYRKMALPILIEEYGFRAFDLAYYPDSITYFKKNWPNHQFELMSFSNANALAQVGSRISKVKMHQPGFNGLRELIARTI
jgi:PHP family Zn ribbon phosphoesterase